MTIVLAKEQDGQVFVARNAIYAPGYTLTVANYRNSATPAGLPSLTDGWTRLEISDEDYAALAALHEAWAAGTEYAVGDRRSYDDRVWECVIGHTSQVGWEPPNVPALWVERAPDNVIPRFVPPTGAQDAWQADDLVTHEGRLWLSLTNANVWEPGVVGTWRDQSDPPIWVAPAGAIGLWQVDDVAEHNGQVWRSTVGNNSWEPGVVAGLWVLAG